jgi:hypothetical protein
MSLWLCVNTYRYSCDIASCFNRSIIRPTYGAIHITLSHLSETKLSMYNLVLITEDPSSRIPLLGFEVLPLKFELHKSRIYYKQHRLRRFKMFVNDFKCNYGSTNFTNQRTNRLKKSTLGGERDRHYTYNVTFRCVSVTVVHKCT